MRLRLCSMYLCVHGVRSRVMPARAVSYYVPFELLNLPSVPRCMLVHLAFLAFSFSLCVSLAFFLFVFLVCVPPPLCPCPWSSARPEMSRVMMSELGVINVHIH